MTRRTSHHLRRNSRRKKPSDLLREQDVPSVFGYELDRECLVPKRTSIGARAAGDDYGCDPLGDGTFRMVPSGDVVDDTERKRRLRRNPSSQRSVKARRTSRRRAPVRANGFSPAHETEADLRWHLNGNLIDLKWVIDPVAGLRAAQRATTYAVILNDDATLFEVQRYTKRFETALYKALKDGRS